VRISASRNAKVHRYQRSAQNSDLAGIDTMRANAVWFKIEQFWSNLRQNYVMDCRIVRTSSKCSK
jgi:hypothetical protein